ncbi:hypothetical protein UNPF46_15360 [Bradyrhizobium sp. UNPF46]|nr:hypothetical protein UNPF46_15360 [Bradyrhizobium sp. UNPF46]
MDERNTDAENEHVGYRRPPRSTRFKKGHSGNPAGRPRGRRRQAPYEAVLGQTVTIREGGRERSITAAEAFVLQLAKRGMEGDGAAARASLALIEQARDGRYSNEPLTIVLALVSPGGVTAALEALRMATKLDPYRETARMVLEAWLVQAALERLKRPLAPAEQSIIVKATRSPQKVRWPGWWSEHP